MERLKNVYRVSADLDNGTAENILVFSHTHDNAIKKAKMYFLRKQHREIDKFAKVEMIHENVIY